MKYFFLPFFLIFQTPSFSIDSLKLVQLETATDSQKIKLLRDISWELRRNDNTKAEAFAIEGMDLAKTFGDSVEYYNLTSNLGIILTYQNKIEEGLNYLNRSLKFYKQNRNESRTAKTLMRIAGIYTNLGDYLKSDSMFLEAKTLYRKLKEEQSLMFVYVNRAINFANWNKYDKAKNSYLEGLKISKNIKDDETTAIIYLNLGVVESKQDNYSAALGYYLQASKNDFKNDFVRGNIYNNIGIIYGNIEEFEKGLEFHKKALAIWRKLGLKKQLSRSLNNTGTILKETYNFGEAFKYFKESLEIIEELEGNNNNLGEVLNNLGSTYIELMQYEKAEVFLKRALETEKTEEDEFGICRSLNNLAEVYRRTGKSKKAIEFGHESLKIADRINYPSIAQKSSFSLSDSYKAIGNYKQAYLYFKKQSEIQDTIWGSENMLKITELEKKYQAEIKETALELKTEQVRVLQTKKNNDQLKIGLLILSTLIATLIAGIVFYFYKSEKVIAAKQNETAKAKIENIQTERSSLQEKVSIQQTQLNDYLKQLFEKSELVLKLKNELAEIEGDTNGKTAISNLNDLLNENLQSKQNWKTFEYHFSMVYKSFFKDLNNAYPRLSTYDLNLCAFIKLNLNNKEISQILGISPDSVKKARQRLFQKMELADNAALKSFIIQL